MATLKRLPNFYDHETTLDKHFVLCFLQIANFPTLIWRCKKNNVVDARLEKDLVK